MLSRPQDSRGVTLIELAVTISILALLLVAVGPSVGTWMRNTQIRNVGTSIQGGLQRARNEALRRNTTVRFSLVSLANSTQMDNSCALSSEAPSWVVSLRAPGGKCAVAPSETDDPMIIERHAGGVGGGNVDVGATVSDASAAASSIAFDGFGRVSSLVAAPLGVIDIDHATPGGDYRALRLVIGNGGNIRMCEPKVNDANDPRKC